MLKSIENQNKYVSKICRGKNKVWGMNNCMMSDVNLQAGFAAIIFTTYPGKCQVTVKVNEKIISNGISSASGSFSCRYSEKLKAYDRVEISIEKIGWKRLYRQYTIY